jgi:hypothetical protein
MAASRYPCRVCQQPTEADDSYAVCPACLADVEFRADGSDGAWSGPDGASGGDEESPPPSHLQVPLAPDEIDARLRKLLNDW